ncbi:MAG: SpoIIE family protein phosphatase [Planctomycetota bacterium]
MPRAVTAVEAGSMDQDRVDVVHLGGTLVLILADGAGGRAGGTEAADGVIRQVREAASDLVLGRVDPVALLTRIDRELARDSRVGEATAVLALLDGGEVRGASVGDSGAWLVSEQGVVDLTDRQVRKPLVGSGAAVPVGFAGALEERRLLLASDGLLKYAGRGKLQAAALSGPLEHASRTLIEAVRLPSGGLPDDVAVILGVG